MSKHCEICNRTYPDDLDACPHCAAAAEISEAEVIDLGADALDVAEEAGPAPIAAFAEGPDSAVDLGLPAVPTDPNGSGSSQGSSISVIEWASLVEEGPAPAEPVAASFDDPADADLIAPAPAGEAAPTGHDSDDALAADLDAVRTIFAGDASASFIRRGPAQPTAPEPPAEDDSALDLFAPAGAEDLPAPAAHFDSGVDLGAPSPTAPEPPSQASMEPEMLEAVDSGIDLAAAELEEQVVADAVGTPPVAPGGRPSSDSSIDLAAADVVEDVTGVPRAAPTGRPSSDSSIDLAASDVVEEPAEVLFVDSGVGLAGPEVVDVAPTPAPVGEAVVRPISDSGIDLSGLEPVGSDSGPQAGIEKDTPDTSDSGIDRIAEEVESGLNLHPEAFDVISDSKIGSGADRVDEIVVGESGTALTAGQLPSGEEEVDLTEITADAVESSAVDLGASATFPVAPPEAASAAGDLDGTQPYETKEKSIHGEEETSASEVDLGSRHDGDAGRDFFEASEALSEAPAGPTTEDEESINLPALDDESALEAPAAVEEEEPAVSEESGDDEAAHVPAKKEKRRSAAGAWVGGVLVGGLVTAGLLLALWLFKIEPPAEWRGFVGGSTGPAMSNRPGPQAAAPVTFADKAVLIRSGDLDRAAKAGVEAADESKPEEVAARGEFRVRKYLADQSMGKAPIKADDEALTKGEADLEKAKDKNVDALFWLAVAKEASDKPDQAKALYEEGWNRTKEQRFQDGLNRLSAKLAGMSRATPTLDPALLVLVVTGLAADQAPPTPPQPPAEQAAAEAGSAFWEATKLAQEGKYEEARAALKKARDLHVQRRFSQLGKAQNPSSDPTEAIFLRSCDDLAAYFAVREALRNSKLPVVKGADPAADVTALAAEDAKRGDDLAQALTDAKGLNEKLTKTNADLTEADDKLQKAAVSLDDTQKKLTDAGKELTATKETLAASEKKADLLAAELKKANDAVAKKTETLKGVADVLTAAKAFKPGDDESALVPAVKEILQSKDAQETAKMVRTLKDERDALKDERTAMQAALKESRPPEQMLSVWLPLLRDRSRPDLAGEAAADADRVLKDDKASPQDKAHAHAVKGLALSDQEKYGEAKAELSRAKTDLSKDDGEWVLETEAALTEASDPSAYYTRKAEDYRKEGRSAQALAMLDRALTSAPPAARAGLLAERGTLRLDAALRRGKGQPAEDDADLAAARKDAEEAKKTGAAGAFYLSGRIDEARGKPDAAADDYRQAVAAHAAADAEGLRYKATLARVLMLKPHEGFAQADPSAAEALKLAGEVLSARDAPFEARAEALAVQGLWTEALNAYVEGIRVHISPERAAVLTAIVEGHPALRRPTVLAAADPLGAAKHYAAGLQWYNDHEYDKAEKEFFTAVEHDGQDARYYYYLGLTRLLQGDRNAFEDFEQGARLERQNRPARAAVSAALERVQGEPRDRLNAIRDRPQ